MKGEIIKRLLLEGNSNSTICQIVNVSSATVSYYARKLGLSKKPRPTYDWGLVQSDIDAGMTVNELVSKYGFARETYSLAVRKAKIKSKCPLTQTSIEEILSFANGRKTTAHERRCIKRGIMRNGSAHCALCGLSEWMGRMIVLEVDHIDGDPRNNVHDNIRLLCPNCHSSTDTWRGRNCRK